MMLMKGIEMEINKKPWDFPVRKTRDLAKPRLITIKRTKEELKQLLKVIKGGFK